MRLSSRSNLVKFHQVNIQEEEARIINSNDRVAEKIAMLSRNIQKSLDDGDISDTDSFSEGIDSDQMSQLFDDMGEPVEGFDATGEFEEGFVGGVSGNVIKAEPVYDGPSPDELIASAKEQADMILTDAQERAEEIQRQAYEEAANQGYQEGVNRAMAEANARIAEIEAEYAAKEEHLTKIYQQKIEEIEPEMVNIITDVYEHVFDVKLSESRELILHLISNVLRKTESAGEYLIHVSPEDHPFVSMQKEQLLDLGGIQSANVELIEDMTLKKNQCLIETENGIFDCSLGVELKELKKQLILMSYNGVEQ